jgi:hypothetical protein
VLGRPVTDESDLMAAEEQLLAREQVAEAASADELGLPFEALGSDAVFDQVVYDGAAFGHAGEVHVGSEEEMDFLGIPGLLEPDQVRDLLRQRQSDRARTSGTSEPSADADPGTGPDVVAHEHLGVLRKELNGLVGAWHHRTGQPHGVTHAELRRACGGPAAAVAGAEQLQARIDRIREWASSTTR